MSYRLNVVSDNEFEVIDNEDGSLVATLETEKEAEDGYGPFHDCDASCMNCGAAWDGPGNCPAGCDPAEVRRVVTADA